MRKPRSPRTSSRSGARNKFEAEAAYADSMFRSALGDQGGAVSALERALRANPSYGPAILSMGSVKYQRGQRSDGGNLFRSLISLPKNTPDLSELIDEAGSFLIQMRAYKDALELYRAAVRKSPHVAVLHQGLGCCAGHEGLHDEAVAASQRAVQLEPDNQRFLNDLGWSLFEGGQFEEAERTLQRAAAMDPWDALAGENLRVCRAQLSRTGKEATATPNSRVQRPRARARPR